MSLILLWGFMKPDDLVDLIFWTQDTVESGHWEKTENIRRWIAEGLLCGDFGPCMRGEIIEKDTKDHA